ncbi:hypothetical protein SDC9_74446 [bioreactor metagenome]|uniref:Uncharacterized protein n=1 Tax=bioreactor metagenome TaxID=1076179 RepID=A0A644YHK0_9ZZZZ
MYPTPTVTQTIITLSIEYIIEKYYHGTILDSAEKIIRSGQFQCSKNPDEWLGIGYYFFAHKSHAKIWAERRSRDCRNSGKAGHEYTPAILSVILSCPDEQVLDLDDPDQLKSLFNEVSEGLERTSSSLHADFQKLPKPKKWFYAIEFYRQTHPEIKMTIYTFSVNPKKYKGDKRIFDYKQRQICAHEHRIISNIRKEA